MKELAFSPRDFGQFIMTGIEGYSLTHEENEVLCNENIGGVILFSRNYQSPEQLVQLTQEIQNTNHNCPLFIAVDQEGGRVQRFKDPFVRIPPMAEIGQLRSSEICKQLHQIIAQQLRAVGVNLSFAPVCDILTNPQNQVIGDRAFSNNPQEVAGFVQAAIEGIKSQGIISVAKHFPGHGDTLEDSHEELPRIQKPIAQMRECEWIPFKKAIESQADMILMAHLQVDAIDSQYPTTLSFKAYDFLRSEFQYNGVIISDDMEMKAISEGFTWEEAAVKALGAGCDILVYHSMPCAQKALVGLSKAMKNRQISQELLAQKIARVKALKEKYFPAEYAPFSPHFPGSISSPQSQSFMVELRKKIVEQKAKKLS